MIKLNYFKFIVNSVLRHVLQQLDIHKFIKMKCISGGFGVDFSEISSDIPAGVGKVAKGLLEQGVTSFCPTVITSNTETYRTVSFFFSSNIPIFFHFSLVC